MTITSKDALDVRAKARKERRRRRNINILYVAVGVVLFFVAWILLAVDASPWSSFWKVVDRVLFWATLDGRSPWIYNIPPPFGAIGPFPEFLGLFRDEGALAHFWQNLGTSERMRINFAHACPDNDPDRINSPLSWYHQISASLRGYKYGGDDGVAIGNMPDYCFGYALHLIVTIVRILIGAALGTIAGLTIGLSSLVAPKIAQVFTPIASFFGTAPIFVAAPFFVIWFGVNYAFLNTIGLVTFYTTLLMYFFSRRAAENIPVGIVESALTLGGTPRSIFRWIYLPGTIPEIAGGFRIALAGAWGLGVLVEVLGIQVGGGHLIDLWRFLIGQIQAPSALVSLITFYGVLAVIVDGVLLVFIRFITRWSEAGRRLSL